MEAFWITFSASRIAGASREWLMVTRHECGDDRPRMRAMLVVDSNRFGKLKRGLLS
jgi:hypothetical protein